MRKTHLNVLLSLLLASLLQASVALAEDNEVVKFGIGAGFNYSAFQRYDVLSIPDATTTSGGIGGAIVAHAAFFQNKLFGIHLGADYAFVRGTGDFTYSKNWVITYATAGFNFNLLGNRHFIGMGVAKPFVVNSNSNAAKSTMLVIDAKDMWPVGEDNSVFLAARIYMNTNFTANNELAASLVGALGFEF